jgi:hypothetical protein
MTCINLLVVGKVVVGIQTGVIKSGGLGNPPYGWRQVVGGLVAQFNYRLNSHAGTTDSRP